MIALKLWVKYPLWMRIVAALILGIAVGVVAPEIATGFKIFGDLFIRLIRMLIVPLIFITIISGIVNINAEDSSLSKILGGSIVIYLGTSFFAIIIGLLTASIIPLPITFSLPLDSSFQAQVAPTLSVVFIELIPSNIVHAMASGDIIQVIVFAILLGIAIKFSGEHGHAVAKLFEDGSVIIMLLTKWIIEIAPIGVFGLIAHMVATQGALELWSLMSLVIVAFLAYILHAVIVLGLLVRIGGGMPAHKFFHGIREATLMAFSSSSSSGTLPISMRNSRENLNVPNHVSGIVLPLGATINMDGTSVFMGVCAVFLAGVYGVDLTMSDYMLVVITGVLASVGTAGVPGAGVIMLGSVLTAVGLPLDGILVIVGVERLLDMGRTALNIAGDCAVARVVTHRGGVYASDLNEQEAQSHLPTVSKS